MLTDFPSPSERLVLIKWEDAAATAAWVTGPMPNPCYCVTVGWILSEDADWTLVAGSVSDAAAWSDLTTIPTRYIREIRPLLAVP